MKIDGPTLPTRAPLLRAHQVERVIAPSRVVNGVEMVSAFIHVDPNATAQIERMGVIIQERFKKFVVAMIPVDKIESVAQIASVKQVNVARKASLHTDMSRFYTKTLQVLDESNAIASGLPCAFTGEGIVVGVIDTGIDFQHAMFMDDNGNSRIKQAYVINDSGSFDSYTGEAIYSLTTDNSGESHGTHTSTTAAGSDLTYNGINYG
ncbi:MAG: S8 family serine peptidase, partial [Muribaculaceae bacterium]|nr:S8 family serine peptidase [Muribaculaceae bacterium]